MERIFMNEQEASERYGYSKAWFQRNRCKSFEDKGPPYIKVDGKVMYPIKRTDEWFNKHLSNTTK